MQSSQLMLNQTLSAALELIINKAIDLDEQSKLQLLQLEQQSLTLLINEFGFPLTFHVAKKQISVIASELSTNCVIQTNIPTLAKLKQSELLTELIKSGELDIIGDPKVAQKFAVIAEHFNIDWQAQLAKYVGDIAAYKLGNMVSKVNGKLLFAGKQISQDSSEYLLHEKKLVVSESEVSQFNKNVTKLSKDVDDLIKKFKQLNNSINK